MVGEDLFPNAEEAVEIAAYPGIEGVNMHSFAGRGVRGQVPRRVRRLSSK